MVMCRGRERVWMCRGGARIPGGGLGDQAACIACCEPRYLSCTGRWEEEGVCDVGVPGGGGGLVLCRGMGGLGVTPSLLPPPHPHAPRHSWLRAHAAQQHH